MLTRTYPIKKQGACTLALLLGAIAPACADSAKAPYQAMAPLAQYRMASQADEIALARTAAPPSISADADVLTLGDHGYQTAAKGHNGFVCIVQRAWASDFNDAEFWNPNLRAPICFNPASARSVVPGYLERTKWVLAGVSKADMMARTKAQIAANTYLMPEAGAMCFMMSKQQYLSDAGRHWHPHLMFFVGHANAAAWGANLKGSQIIAAEGDPEPVVTFMVPVAKWSDGTPEVMAMH